MFPKKKSWGDMNGAEKVYSKTFYLRSFRIVLSTYLDFHEFKKIYIFYNT
jgi:hypothetical protein